MPKCIGVMVRIKKARKRLVGIRITARKPIDEYLTEPCRALSGVSGILTPIPAARAASKSTIHCRPASTVEPAGNAPEFGVRFTASEGTIGLPRIETGLFARDEHDRQGLHRQGIRGGGLFPGAVPKRHRWKHRCRNRCASGRRRRHRLREDSSA